MNKHFWTYCRATRPFNLFGPEPIAARKTPWKETLLVIVCILIYLLVLGLVGGVAR